MFIRRILLAVVCALALPLGSGPLHAAATTASGAGAWQSGWESLKDEVPHCLAWSPDGKMIAFCTTGLDADGDIIEDISGIWIAQVPAKGEDVKLRRLFGWRDSENHTNPWPGSLFWVSDRQLAWVSFAEKLSIYDPNEGPPFRFYTSDIDKPEVKHFIEETFDMSLYSGPFSPGESGGVSDVYWDPQARILAFSGIVSGPQDFGGVLYIYRFIDKRLNTVTFDPLFISVCGSGKPGSHLCSLCGRPVENSIRIWRGDLAYNFANAGEVKDKAGDLIFYLRCVPQSDLLSCLDVSDRSPSKGSIVTIDRNNSPKRVIAQLSLKVWKQVRGGSPYAWSPDGKRLAYLDGSKIKIIDVPAATIQKP